MSITRSKTVDMSRREIIAASGAVLFASSARAMGAASIPGHPPRIDTLCIDDPSFDARSAVDAGFDGAVVDLDIFPRERVAALDALEQWRRGAAKPDAAYQLVLRADDFATARTQRKFGVMLACQDAAILGASTYSVSDDNLDNLREYYYRGLRVLQITHNERNALGDSFQEQRDAGLSRLGHAVVDSMSDLGMIVDLSHCSDLTTAQAIQSSRKPVAVTHAGCRALFESARDKSDPTIRALADKGGYFGVFMMTRWLVQDPKRANVEAVVDHIDHVVKTGGIDLVGFASDQSVAGDTTPQADRVRRLQNYQQRNLGVPGADPLHGHETAADLETPSRMALLDRALAKRGYSAINRDKVLGENFVSYVRRVCV